MDSGRKWIDTTLRSSSREGGSRAYIYVRSTRSNGKKLRTWHSSLLINCTKKLTNSSATSRSLQSFTIMYPAMCFTASLLGDVIQTTWGCLESDCSFLLSIRLRDGAQCCLGYYQTYCTKVKFQQKPGDLEDLLNTSVNSNITAQDGAYVPLVCHYDCVHGFNYIRPMLRSRTSPIQTKMCPHRNAHISERENYRPVYAVQCNASICVDV